MYDDLFGWPVILFAPDGNGGGGGAGNGNGEDDPDPDTDNAAGADDGGNSGEAGLDSLDLTPEQQKALNAVIAQRVDREKAKAEKLAEEAREKAKREAEEARLAEKQEFQTLAQKRQETIQEQEAEIQTLQEKAKLADKYEKSLKGYRDQVFEHVPDHIKDLLKGRDVADQLDWISANMDKLQSEDGDGQRLYVGPPPAPKGGKKGAGDNGLSPDEKREKAYRPRF